MIDRKSSDHLGAAPELVLLLADIHPSQRPTLLLDAVAFRPSRTLDLSFFVGSLRAAFADYWEAKFDAATPVAELRRCLTPPVRVGTVLRFNALNFTPDEADIAGALDELVIHLAERLRESDGHRQQFLFRPLNGQTQPDPPVHQPAGRAVESLASLLAEGCQFPTIYSDPPWPYDNEASRAAAINHYPVMSLAEIEAEPIGKLAAPNAHLHLWTTSAFLREAFRVIDAWGFLYKSCLVWVKPNLGMGNYLCLSHEYLLLGVRGNLTFRDRTLPSWIQADRTAHSRKPAVVRTLIERVSPGPYLELYGREQLPDSEWTVYGNQVQPRLF